MAQLRSEKILTDGQLRAIGIIAVEWSYMEVMLQLSIWRLLNVSLRTGVVITGDMTAGQLMNLLTPLADTVCKFEPIHAPLKKLLGDIAHLLSERNKAIHLIHIDREGEKLAVRFKRSTKLEKFSPSSEQQLLALAHQINDARLELRAMDLPKCDPMQAKLISALVQLKGDGAQ